MSNQITLTATYGQALEQNSQICPKCSDNNISYCKCHMGNKLCNDCNIAWYKCNKHGWIVDDAKSQHISCNQCKQVNM